MKANSMNEAEIFAKVAGENDPEKRDDILNKLCEADSKLKTRVQHLVAAHEKPDSFFDDPVHMGHDRELEVTSLKVGFVQAGSMVGPYKLLQEIGEGGSPR